jgi:hypothetical protein
MTTKPKPEAKADDQVEAEQAVQPEPTAVEQAVVEGPRCGAPHFLPVLAGRVACQLDAQDLEPGEAGHEHRHQDGDTLYNWR